jgi:hypothetical protein
MNTDSHRSDSGRKGWGAHRVPRAVCFWRGHTPCACAAAESIHPGGFSFLNRRPFLCHSFIYFRVIRVFRSYIFPPPILIILPILSKTFPSSPFADLASLRETGCSLPLAVGHFGGGRYSPGHESAEVLSGKVRNIVQLLLKGRKAGLTRIIGKQMSWQRLIESGLGQ